MIELKVHKSVLKMIEEQYAKNQRDWAGIEDYKQGLADILAYLSLKRMQENYTIAMGNFVWAEQRHIWWNKIDPAHTRQPSTLAKVWISDELYEMYLEYEARFCGTDKYNGELLGYIATRKVSGSPIFGSTKHISETVPKVTMQGEVQWEVANAFLRENKKIARPNMQSLAKIDKARIKGLDNFILTVLATSRTGSNNAPQARATDKHYAYLLSSTLGLVSDISIKNNLQILNESFETAKNLIYTSADLKGREKYYVSRTASLKRDVYSLYNTELDNSCNEDEYKNMGSKELLNKVVQILDKKLTTGELYAVWLSLDSNEFGLFDALGELHKERMKGGK